MATSYTASFLGVTFGNNKSLATIYNRSGSSLIVRIYRITILNNQTVAVTNGVLTTIELRKISASTVGANVAGNPGVNVLKHDTNSANLHANIEVSTGATDTVGADTFRRFMWSTDEPAATAATIDEWECLPVFNIVWDSGYADTNLDPIVLRANEGLSIKQPGANTLGICDICIEFTTAAS